MNIILIIMTIFIYIGMILNTKKRTATALLGAGTLLLIGTLTSSFDVAKAFTSFPSEIIILLIVLSLFTDIFECGISEISMEIPNIQAITLDDNIKSIQKYLYEMEL